MRQEKKWASLLSPQRIVGGQLNDFTEIHKLKPTQMEQNGFVAEIIIDVK